MWGSLCVVVCLTLGLAGAAPKTASLPKEFKICPRGDDVCLKEAITDCIPYFVKGVPSLGVYPADPLLITDMAIAQGSGPVNLNITLKNQKLTGLRNIRIDKVHSDFQDDTYLLEVDLNMESIQSTGHYSVNGKVLILPIRGEGENNITLMDVLCKAVIKGHIKDGFVHLDSFTMKLKTSRTYIQLDNLFNGDQTLGDNMNQFLNDNWETLTDEVMPAIEEAFSAVYIQIAQRVYSKVPYNEVHPKA